MKQTAKSERHFVLDGQYEALFRANGIQVEEALRKLSGCGSINNWWGLFATRRRKLSITQSRKSDTAKTAESGVCCNAPIRTQSPIAAPPRADKGAK